jgi:hypothetical protein
VVELDVRRLQAKNQRKAKKQAAREEAAAKWRAANP